MKTKNGRKNFVAPLIIAAALMFALLISIREEAEAQNDRSEPTIKTSAATGEAVGAKTDNPPAPGFDAASQNSAPLFVTEIPPGYRDWKLITVAHEEGNLTDIRAVLGNDIAIKAYREGTLPLPEGAIIARIAWSYNESEENNRAFEPFLKQGFQKSFVAGPPTNGVQFMIKDSKKYAATGGWGYGHFDDGKPAGEKFMQSCYPCHQAIKSRDFVFARYSP